MKQRSAAAESAHFHAVRFYEDEQSLARIVSGFVGDGVGVDVPAILIATPSHCQSIVDHLRMMSFDVEGLRRDGRLSVLDAEETLTRIMVNGMPSPERCQDIFAPALDAALEKP